MAEPDEKAVLLLRNLKDAGCDTAMTEQFLAYEREGRSKDQRRLLFRQRNSLLQTVHKNQERIDCLDFLLHSVEQKIKSSRGEN
ncbi:hypothetical protein [Victivallis sp. Marseille-Q1083]|uniref:hypothetical protein n=1 Tax=Victivallis sp. Marseille-Q1083 TaxID=2717288 RepID=UPI001C3782B4|nr:hypothetical protein [Victivallis sp. Marseille-Q1083]